MTGCAGGEWVQPSRISYVPQYHDMQEIQRIQSSLTDLTNSTLHPAQKFDSDDDENGLCEEEAIVTSPCSRGGPEKLASKTD